MTKQVVNKTLTRAVNQWINLVYCRRQEKQHDVSIDSLQLEINQNLQLRNLPYTPERNSVQTTSQGGAGTKAMVHEDCADESCEIKFKLLQCCIGHLFKYGHVTNETLFIILASLQDNTSYKSLLRCSSSCQDRKNTLTPYVGICSTLVITLSPSAPKPIVQACSMSHSLTLRAVQDTGRGRRNKTALGTMHASLPGHAWPWVEIFLHAVQLRRPIKMIRIVIDMTTCFFGLAR